MNTAEFVAALIKQQKEEGIDPQQIVWNAALACVGWPYVFGARGDWCDPQNRRARYRDDHPTIKTACRNFDGLSGCTGCKWYPGGKRVRCFDCRGFTYYWLKQVYGWTLQGAGATSQWNTASNWKDKGPISTIPEDTLVCLFVQKGKTMEHTGFGFRGQTVECSVNVQHFDKRNRKWTHWAVPMCIDQEPSPTPITKPTLRQGDSGPYVAEMQQELIAWGYDVGATGADGKFGKNTRSALIAFQTDKGLTADGVCGPKTWEELDRDPTGALYTVHIPHLTKWKAETIVAAYAGGAYMTPDEGR
jgi:hypothetical protein